MPIPRMLRNLQFSVALDNYNPPRKEDVGFIEEWTNEAGNLSTRMPEGREIFPNALNAIYLLDDGKSVVPHYVTGWNDTDPALSNHVYLGAFPVNPNGKRRPDGYVIDFRSWSLGPQRAFHLKLNGSLARD